MFNFDDNTHSRHYFFDLFLVLAILTGFSFCGPFWHAQLLGTTRQYLSPFRTHRPN